MAVNYDWPAAEAWLFVSGLPVSLGDRDSASWLRSGVASRLDVGPH